MASGIYVHVPFCASFCIYCDFYSVKGGSFEGYRDALLEEIVRQRGYFKNGVLPETLYFGGGTPSLLDTSYIEQIASAIKLQFGVSDFKEFTIEVNPDDVFHPDDIARSRRKLDEYRRMGINRISMGVQSFQDEHLRWMNRRHTAVQAVEAFRLLRECGFDNISIDLIFGFAKLTREQWADNISKALELSPEHISCYQMMLEKGSALYALAKKGKYAEPAQEECAWQYAYLQRKLTEAGYEQYEISNFCKEGYQSRHNSNYWERTPYLGLGPAAHSFDGETVRKWNVASVKSYISALREGKYDVICTSERLTDADIFNEQVMLGLRKTAGFSLNTLDSKMLAKVMPALESMLSSGELILDRREEAKNHVCAESRTRAERYGHAAGLEVTDGDIIRIPPDKLFVSDGIIERLFIT